MSNEHYDRRELLAAAGAGAIDRRSWQRRDERDGARQPRPLFRQRDASSPRLIRTRASFRARRHGRAPRAHQHAQSDAERDRREAPRRRVSRARGRGRRVASREATRWGRCTACRSPSRISKPAVGFPVHARLADLQGRACRPRTRVLVERLRRAGVDSDRQDQRARVRHGVAHLQQGLRHDRQSVRRHEERRRLERRRRRGARDGHAADRRRQRPGRLAAQSRQLQQHRRVSADRRARADVRRRRFRCSASRSTVRWRDRWPTSRCC